MSINTSHACTIPESTLNYVIKNFIEGHTKKALETLKSCDCEAQQKNVIKKILNQAKFDRKIKGLNNRVIAVRQCIYTELNKKITESSLSFYGAEVPKDLIYEICAHCVSMGSMKSIEALARTNKHLHRLLTVEKNCMELSPAFLDRVALTELCPKLRILDLGMTGFTVDDVPPFPTKDWVVRAYQKIARHVESDAGVTLQCMPKNFHIFQIVEDVKKYGTAVWKGGGANNTHGDSVGFYSIGETYWVIVANNVAKKSCGMLYEKQIQRISTMGCKPATPLELIFLCVGTKKCFDQCLLLSPICARTTLEVAGSPVSVGNGKFDSNTYALYYMRDFGYTSSGCGMVPSLKFSPT